MKRIEFYDNWEKAEEITDYLHSQKFGPIHLIDIPFGQLFNEFFVENAIESHEKIKLWI